jgi:hypothetical protein
MRHGSRKRPRVGLEIMQERLEDVPAHRAQLTAAHAFNFLGNVRPINVCVVHELPSGATAQQLGPVFRPCEDVKAAALETCRLSLSCAVVYAVVR